MGYLGLTTDWEHRFEPDFPRYAQISRSEPWGLTVDVTDPFGNQLRFCELGPRASWGAR
jgi:hypothetical protein